MSRLSRRSLLTAVGTATLSVAGCLEMVTDATSDTDGTITLSTLDVQGSDGDEIAVHPDGSVALLDFFATWCPPCKPQMAELGIIREEYPEIHMLSISWEEDTGAIRSFWEEYNGNWPVAQDTKLEAAQAYSIDGRLPTKILLGPEGEQHWRETGLSAAETISEQIEQTLS